MKRIENGTYTGERALFMSEDIHFFNCVFEDGESPLKESHNLEIHDSEFRWKYPLWYCKDIKCFNIKIFETGRSGIWYTKNIEIIDSVIDAPKTFRRSEGVSLINVKLKNAQETFWNCKNIKLNHVETKGDYFGMNCDKVDVIDLLLDGNYCFDGAKNITIRNSTLISKDSFWNSENVTVINSTINGEYLAWNSKNVTFINCKIISHQGLCYMQGIKMINCELIDSDLVLEYCSDIDVEIVNEVDSIKNPSSGAIRVKGVKELILENNKIDVSKTQITDLYGNKI